MIRKHLVLDNVEQIDNHLVSLMSAIEKRVDINTIKNLITLSREKLEKIRSDVNQENDRKN